MKRPTIKDVARHAGVSVSVASRVFTSGSVAQETRRKVEASAQCLAYRPNPLARGLVGNRSNTITLVCGSLADPFDAAFLECLAERLADQGRRLVIAPASRRSADSGALLQALDDRSDAAIVSAGTMPLEQIETCLQAGLPVIVCGRLPAMEGIDAVAADNVDGGRQALELLVRTRCQRLAYLGSAAQSMADIEREQGFVDAATLHGCAVTTHRPKHGQDIFDFAASILSSRDRPDGVFATTDRLATIVLEAARSLGLDVPGELSIIGFNNVPVPGHANRGLTTIDYPPAQVVDVVLELLEFRLMNLEASGQRRRIAVSLVPRATTRIRKT